MSMIRAKWDSEHITEAVKRHNAIAEGLALAVPEVSALLDGAKITGNMVDKRTRDAINAVIKKRMPCDTWARCFLDTQYTYTLYLKADFNSQCTEHTCAYSETSVAVARKGDDNKWCSVKGGLPAVLSVDDVKAAIATAEAKAEAAYRAQSEANDAKSACGGFVI